MYIGGVEGCIEYLKTKSGIFTIKKYYKGRSIEQNRYFWSIVIKILSDETGYTPDEMHEALKYMFLTDKTGKIPKVRSTTDLSTVEFNDYCKQIQRWASMELGVNIPDPNEVPMKFYENDLQSM